MQRQVGAAGEAVPVDLGDHREVAFPQSGPSGREGEHGRDVALQRVPPGEVTRLEVLGEEPVPRRERGAGPADDHDPGLGVGLELLDGA